MRKDILLLFGRNKLIFVRTYLSWELHVRLKPTTRRLNMTIALCRDPSNKTNMDGQKYGWTCDGRGKK